MSPVKASTTFPIKPISENMLTIIAGDSGDLEVNQKVFKLYHHLLKHRHASWMDVIPAYATLSIVYDVTSIKQQHASGFEWMKNHIEELMMEDHDSETILPRQLQVPVCYDREFALDADRIITERNISWDELIALHASTFYHTFMIG